MKIKVYVEGGGQTRNLRAGCRRGFGEFLQKAGLREGDFRITASGPRNKAYDDFCDAMGSASACDFIVLLVDSESPVAANSSPWQHLRDRDGWERPAGAENHHAQLMVQCMESWFLADKEALADFFGHEFRRNALPAGIDIEQVVKDDLLRGLKQATRYCQKGEYRKGRHSFEILGRIDPSKVVAASPHTKHLIETLKEKVEV